MMMASLRVLTCGSRRVAVGAHTQTRRFMRRRKILCLIYTAAFVVSKAQIAEAQNREGDGSARDTCEVPIRVKKAFYFRENRGIRSVQLSILVSGQKGARAELWLSWLDCG